MRITVSRFSVLLLLIALGRPEAYAGPLEDARASMKAGEACLFADRLDSALALYRRAAQLLTNLPSARADFFQCHNAIADLLSRKNRFAEAESLACATEREARAELGEDHVVLAVTYQLLGSLYTYRDRFSAARDCFARALAIRRGHYKSDDPRIADCLYGLGDLEIRAGNFERSEGCLLEAKRIYSGELKTQWFTFVNTSVLLGRVHDELGQIPRAIQDVDEALSILKQRQGAGSSSEAYCLHALSLHEGHLGRIDDALRHEKESCAIARRLYGNRHSMVMASLSQLGYLMTIQGDVEAALHYYQEALAVSVDLVGPNHPGTFDIQRRLGHLYSENGEWARAETCLVSASEGTLRILGPNHPHLSYSFASLGDIARKKGEYVAACRRYARAIALRLNKTTGGGQPEVVELCCRLAETYLDQGRADSAGQVLLRGESYMVPATGSNRPLQSKLLMLRGRIAAEKGNFQDALRLYQGSLSALVTESPDTLRNDNMSVNPPLHAPGLRLEYLRVLAEKARLLSSPPAGLPAEGFLRASLGAYNEAARLVDLLRSQYTMENSKLALEDRWSSLFVEAQRVALKLTRLTGDERFTRLAFAFSERAKSPVLREIVAGDRGTGRDSLGARMARSRKELNILARTVEFASDIGDTGKEDFLRKRLLQKSEEYATLYDSLREKGGRTLESPEAALRGLQQRLGLHASVLEYAVSQPFLIAYCISHDTMLVRERRLPPDFWKSVGRLVKGIRTVDGPCYIRAARELSRELILPFRREMLSCKKVMIVPDGPLHFIPFETLFVDPVRTGGAGGTDFRRLPYLVTRCEVSYAPAAAMTGAQAGEAEGGGAHRSFAGFAPVFKDQPAPLWSADFARGKGGARSVTFDGKRFNELPGSEAEVERIARAFRKAGARAVSVTGREATKQNFEEIAPGYDILHVASHGYYNERRPQLSGILFAAGSGDSSAGGSAFLYAGEAYSLSLKSDLVVLSSCESGAGKMNQGEGIVGLTRGLMLSGARHVMFSLWKVRDQSTSTMMQSFYRRILHGAGFHAALRKTKLSLIKNEATAFPLHWASFVITGRWPEVLPATPPLL